MLPTESEFYEFNDVEKGIVFKANDGTQWIIHSNTLVATPYIQPQNLADKSVAEGIARQLQDR
jgi:hypothetical protein